MTADALAHYVTKSSISSHGIDCKLGRHLIIKNDWMSGNHMICNIIFIFLPNNSMCFELTFFFICNSEICFRALIKKIFPHKNLRDYCFSYYKLFLIFVVILYIFFSFQLFERNPEERLGMPNSPAGSIRTQSFFKSIDWDKLERRQVDPPFKPKIVRILSYWPLGDLNEILDM